MKTFNAMFKTECKLAIRVADVPIFSFIFPLLVAIILGLVYGKTNTEMIGKTFASVSTIGMAAMGLMGLPLTLGRVSRQQNIKTDAGNPREALPHSFSFSLQSNFVYLFFRQF